MRVIAGEFRSRRLKSIPGLDTRPTPDRLRETLFDILAPKIENVTFLDAYAGTGAVGIEALSRGAAHAIFVEKNRAAVDVIRENLRSLDLEQRATVVLGKVAFELAQAPERHRLSGSAIRAAGRVCGGHGSAGVVSAVGRDCPAFDPPRASRALSSNASAASRKAR